MGVAPHFAMPNFFCRLARFLGHIYFTAYQPIVARYMNRAAQVTGVLSCTCTQQQYSWQYETTCRVLSRKLRCVTAGGQRSRPTLYCPRASASFHPRSRFVTSPVMHTSNTSTAAPVVLAFFPPGSFVFVTGHVLLQCNGIMIRVELLGLIFLRTNFL